MLAVRYVTPHRGIAADQVLRRSYRKQIRQP